ncbi:Salmonella virulence plasmid 28.1kDa A protein [Pseudomonas sp. 31 R 17]|uniref:Tc toxin subunit A n=1 Tax=Pseudomonas sp. 31 R 17 TaxID=1844101 RepID=UPI000811EBDB|nr:Tc toxin subunit A [Pseudomonas sp. 31 R 17]CRM45447.1 Salmonella virulence plasmid 28.1kDa A protein [Pseudomonas sp. 31 R 17]
MDNESRSDRLLRTLVVDEPELQVEDLEKVSFINAMQQLGMESVFDIIAQPKPHFVQRLGEICEADGEVAYDNAMCYAVQIGRLYREHRVSSGRAQDPGMRTGVRALVDVGPSFPNLFKENWDEFCKVGDIAAVDSPVSYLCAQYRFATRTLEGSGQGTRPKILLETRRRDLQELIIDQHSTFTPRPMLELVNEILMADITRYRSGMPDKNKPIYEVLAERRYPFMFPYYYPHHQCRLGLAEKKLELGELSYRISLQLPISQRGLNDYGVVQNAAAQAQLLMSGLSPQQQQLLIEPSLFTTFYLSKAELTGVWRGPGTSHLSPHSAIRVGLLIPPQPSLKSVDPQAQTFVSNVQLTAAAAIEFSGPEGAKREGLFWINSSWPGYTSTFGLWTPNYLHPANTTTICTAIRWGGEGPFPIEPGYRASFTVTSTSGTTTQPVSLAVLSFTIVLDEYVTWTAEQQAFFQHNYGLQGLSDIDSPLVQLETFMQRTELDAEQVEALISQRQYFPRVSPNCPSGNPQWTGSAIDKAYPHASHYGACYVNGHGSERYDSGVPVTIGSTRADQFDNSMDLRETTTANRTVWYLTKTSPQRFDRLQRMIRLQRWLQKDLGMNLSFAELDTLLICAIRSEGEHNLTMDLNTNTLRVLGVYRYFSRRYGIQPEEFAAFLHDLTPYATGDRVPLFDQVFNPSALFDTPLVLNRAPFNVRGTDAANKKIVAQLCVALGLEPTESSLFRLAGQTKDFVGPLLRDLGTLSSLYRQARIAKMFGLSAEESWGLVDMLGGVEYQRLLCTGRLLQPSLSSFSTWSLAARGDNDLSIRLVLVVDAAQEGNLLRLLPGSALFVLAGTDFAAATGTRVFTLERQPQYSDEVSFVRNLDGSTLTLEPLSAGGTLSLSGKTLSRSAWEVITDQSSSIHDLQVKCGALPKKLLPTVEVWEENALEPAPDVLDVLMQMDWAVNWLKDSKQSVTAVRRALGLEPGDYLPPQGMVDRLGLLAAATREVLITDEQISALNLPVYERPSSAGAREPIKWREVLQYLLDPQGLVNAVPLTGLEDPHHYLQGAIEYRVGQLNLFPHEREKSVAVLTDLLLAGHDRQLRLIEGLVQEMINLPMDRTQVVLRWAQTSVHTLLSAVLGLATASATDSLLSQFERVLRHGKVVMDLRLSTSALRVFLLNPQWLGVPGKNLELNLKSFYLLSRYSQWFHGQSQAEEALLGYFIAANPGKTALKNKTLRAAVSDQAASVLARLVGWQHDEVHHLFQQLAQKRACSMADIDWILRSQATCAASGLAAADLLRATALHGDSTGTAWQTVGDAVMAARR